MTPLLPPGVQSITENAYWVREDQEHDEIIGLLYICIYLIYDREWHISNMRDSIHISNTGDSTTYNLIKEIAWWNHSIVIGLL